VTIKSKQGVSIDAGTGTLELKGQTIDIKGTSSVKLASAAGASVELAAASTTIKGQPVQLNPPG
jgi:PDZ domain-containing secreted protein